MMESRSVVIKVFLVALMTTLLSWTSVSAQLQGTTLVCVSPGPESFGLDEWTPQQIAGYVQTNGHEPAHPHPMTGSCYDPAGLMIPGWASYYSWSCEQERDGTWRGPSWNFTTPRPEYIYYPSAATGACPGSSSPPHFRSEVENAAITATHLTELESVGEYEDLYGWMHPDSKAVIPMWAMMQWYQANVTPNPPVEMEVNDVRFVEWTWEVTGTSYPSTAEVSFTARYADGAERDEVVRLVRDNGVWRWFFGRSQEFVEDVLATYGN